MPVRKGLVRFGPGLSLQSVVSKEQRLEHVAVLIRALQAEETWLRASLAPGNVALPTIPDHEPSLQELNTVREVAAFVKVSVRTVQRAIARGELEARRVGFGARQGVRVTEVAVWNWLAASRPTAEVEQTQTGEASSRS